jgi:membrane associated rhomboid family serine protease
MPAFADEQLLELLRAIDRLAPAPLYAASFAASSGVKRESLDEALDYLRLRGLVRLTDWVQGQGQGYALTSRGIKVLEEPRLLKRAQLPPAPALAGPPDRPTGTWDRGEAVRETLLNPVRPVVCGTLIVLNFLMFALGLFLALREGVDLSAYLGAGANVKVNIIRDELGALIPQEVLVKNEWWRLLSYAFVHGGLLHIIMNMYFLYSLGPLLETMWGSARFLVLYLVGAFTGGCAVMLTMRGAVGASGALCGLLTSLGVWVYLNRSFLPPNIVSNWMRNVFTNIMLIVIISVYFPRVSWEGHLGGALGGAFVSVPLNYLRFGRGWQKIAGLAGVVAIPAIALAWVVYTQEPIVDEIKVRVYLERPYREAEDGAVFVYRTQAGPLMNDWKHGLDQSRLAVAQAASQTIQQKLQETLELFKELGPYRDQEVADAVQKATHYLEEWSKFYALFAKTALLPPPWTPAQNQALSQQWENVVNACRPLTNSPILPARLARLFVNPKNQQDHE